MDQLTKWLKSMCVAVILLVLVAAGAPVHAQDSTSFTLEQAYALAQKNYPVIRQKDLVRRTADINISNITKSFWPQLILSGQATYQSDVTSVPVKIPGIDIESPAKDQYKILADVNQVIYDGGSAAAQKNVQQVNALVEDQKAEVELYKVKERINQLYLGILLYDEQINQVNLVKNDIALGIKRVSAQVQNGTALRSNQLVLEAELLKNDQRLVEIKAGRQGLIDVLSLFINQPLPATTRFEKPLVSNTVTTLNRPELKLFAYQDSLFKTQQQLISVRNRPRASLFVQGGYGRPGLNMLKNDFDLFYVAGVRFNWSLGSLYTTKKERELLTINQRMTDVQKDLFLLNTNTQLKQQQAELNKWQQLAATDAAIIDLRGKIKEAAHAQLQNGVITANDFLREVNAEDQARLSLIMHELQLLQARLSYQTLSGNQ